MNTCETQQVVESYSRATVGHFGALCTWKDHAFTLAGSEKSYNGKLWIKELMGLTGTEVSLSSLPVGGSVPYDHTHAQNEELYIFLSGEGEMLLDGKIVPVTGGSVVRVDPACVRCWRNTGEVELVHLVIQSRAGSLEQWTAEDGTVLPDAPNWEV